jgi:hypothetical protein
MKVRDAEIGVLPTKDTARAAGDIARRTITMAITAFEADDRI